MAVQSVTSNELDGQLGVLPSGTRALAIVGPTTGGTANTPSLFASTAAVIASFTGGQGVEDANWHITTKSLPVLMVKSAASVASTFDTIDVTGVTGTSVATVHTGATSTDDFEAYLYVSNGGTIGVAGITVQYSLDNGRVLSVPQALGTAVFYLLPEGGAIRFDFAAGTLVTGDVIKARFHAPQSNASDLTTALAALKNSAIDWEICFIACALTTTSAAAVSTAFAGMPEKAWCSGVDLPTSTQTETTYLSTLTAAWAAVADSQCVGLVAGAARITSAISGRSCAQSPSGIYASTLASVREHVDITQLNIGAQKGTFITDVNGNPVSAGILLHDERLFPGLDDQRFCVLQSKDGRAGVYFANPNCFSAQGSDFKYAQHRRVMNKLKRILRLYLETRLSVEILVNASTGYILESEAQDIEFGANEICRSSLTGQVSGGAYDNGAGFLQVSRTDNLLSGSTMNTFGGAVPLAYPKAIILNTSYKNPTLRVRAVPGT